MTEEVDTIAHYTFTKERQPKAMSKLSYHQPNQPFQKIMRRVILNQLKVKAEELLEEEQAGFGPGWGTVVEQIFNSHHKEAPTTPVQSVPKLYRLQDSV